MAKESYIGKISLEISEIIERASKSIVLVQGRRFPSPGIVWQKDLVITTDHSLPRSQELQLEDGSGEAIPAIVAGRDPSTDIALLKISKELQPVQNISRENLRAGQLTIVAGRALGGRVLSVLSMISGVSETYQNWRGGTFDQFIRLDTQPYPGFSGSAILLPDGAIAGIGTSVFSRHFGLVIPSSNIERLVQRLKEKGSIGKPYLGLMMQPVRLPEKLQQESGAQIGLMLMGTEAASPAEQAGLLLADIIVRFQGKTVNSMEEIHRFLTEESIGKDVRIDVLRGGKTQEFNVKVGERVLRQKGE